MVLYPETEKEARFKAEILQNIAKDIFQRCGMNEADASQLSDSLVDANLCGIRISGYF